MPESAMAGGLAWEFAAGEMSFMDPDAGVRLEPAPRSYGMWALKVQRLAAALCVAGFVFAGAMGAARAAERTIKVVALGDSLTAGYQLPADAAFPAQLEQALKAKGLAVEVVNAGVSGDTSAGGLARLDWALQGDVRILVVALGGNDALRALPAEELRRNLGAIIEKAQSRGITVMLAGMEAPPNFGRDYIVSFHNVYPALATQYHVAFVPFLLQGVAGSDALNQRDGIHPTAEGARILADTVWTVLKPLADTQRHTGS
jgi:acyl-CoA thioesterase-1